MTTVLSGGKKRVFSQPLARSLATHEPIHRSAGGLPARFQPSATRGRTARTPVLRQSIVLIRGSETVEAFPESGAPSTASAPGFKGQVFSKKSLPVAFVVLAAFICSLVPMPASAASTDPVIFTFAVTGDSRQDAHAKGLTPQQKIWMQDTKPLSRIVREIQAQKPQALFFSGDMIMGYTTNFAITERQYAYWRGLMSVLPQTGTYLVPIPGNHEMQVKLPNPGGRKPLKISERECENLWRENMGDLILDTHLWNRLTGTIIEDWDVNHTPRIGGLDGIQSDQRQLTFSFDVGKMHFAVINTSAYKDDARAPVHWLAGDFLKAKARGDRNFFVFGHKMAFTYRFNDKVKAGGLDKHPINDAVFWNLIQDYHATYFCAHEHLYHATQPHETGPNGSWQIICGAAGAPFDAKPGESRNPDDRDFAWVLVKVHASGEVRMNAYGFNEHFGPTHLLQTIELSPPPRQ